MNTKNHYCANVVLGALLLAFSQLTWSLGLGEAKVESFLGQPLVANIELITRPTDDLSSVSAGLASAADYDLIGASRDDISVPLQFTIENQGGQAYIVVRSRLSVDNPIVRLILEVNWSSGRMLREYTLFLDPPTFSQPAPAPRVETERKIPAQAAPAPSIEADKTVAAQAATSTSASSGDSTMLAGDDYGPVQSGDTLWRIASDWSGGSGLNLNKVMLAIQRENPQAFSNNNINLLQRGAILRMPQINQVNALSSAAARAEVQDQADAFQSRRSRSAASASVPLIAEESVAVEPVAIEQIAPEPPAVDETLTAEMSTESASTEPTPAQLELLPPSEDNSLDSTAGFEEVEADDDLSPQELREELSRKEEELFNQQQQNTYLEQRLVELESQLEQSREGTVDDSNLASMEERLRQERLSDEPAAVPQVVTLPTAEESWYERFSLWLLGLLVVVAVLVGWLVSRRGGADTVVSELGSGDDALRKIKDEAKEVLRRLDSAAEEEVDHQEADDEVTTAQPGEAATAESEDTQVIPARKKPVIEDEEAQVLDEDSPDPEIQLDLARAYVSMGDKEAARVILEEVIANGSEEQRAEANKMKNLL